MSLSYPPQERSVSDLLFWDLFPFRATDVHFDLGGEETVPQFSLIKKEGQCYFLFFLLWVSWPVSCFCQTGHLSILHSAQWGLHLGYSPKAQYCRRTALISYKLVVAFLIQWCLMLYVEHQSAGANDCQARLWEAQRKLQPWSCCHSKRKGCWVSGEKWEGRTWH